MTERKTDDRKKRKQRDSGTERQRQTDRQTDRQTERRRT